MNRPHAAPCLCVACLVAVIPSSEHGARDAVRHVFRAEPFTDAELTRTAPTLRAPARRKAPRR